MCEWTSIQVLDREMCAHISGSFEIICTAQLLQVRTYSSVGMEKNGYVIERAIDIFVICV